MYCTTYRSHLCRLSVFIYIRFCDEEALRAEALAVYYSVPWLSIHVCTTRVHVCGCTHQYYWQYGIGSYCTAVQPYDTVYYTVQLTMNDGSVRFGEKDGIRTF